LLPGDAGTVHFLYDTEQSGALTHGCACDAVGKKPGTTASITVAAAERIDIIFFIYNLAKDAYGNTKLTITTLSGTCAIAQ
jgi:hypothetical protein